MFKTEKALGLYIEGFYSPNRWHSALGDQLPMMLEKRNEYTEKQVLHFILSQSNLALIDSYCCEFVTLSFDTLISGTHLVREVKAIITM
ncbi:hypothetical protein [Polycladidibacter stylochi]|uniref:hypothetical protein n=1 Tax=Polycladidibacter stylochi TaxID=1807766 RepID=UPI00082C0B9A|nr:hypothetical protein [Pseudovibrio stylochi]